MQSSLRYAPALRLTLLAAAATLALTDSAAAVPFTGAVYAGTNAVTGNGIAAYGQNANGTLSPIGTFATGGLGGMLDDGNGLDPLISEDSIVAVDGRFLLAVNAGSNTVSSFRINRDFSLSLIGTAPSGGFGPNSIAHRDGLVYVTNADRDGQFTGPPDQVGNLTGFRLDRSTGELTPIEGSTRALANRPSDIEFAPNGGHLVVASVNAGSAALPAPNADQLASFGVLADGRLTEAPVGTAASTLPGNAQGRNLPTTIGFEIVERDGRQYVVASEAREFTPEGGPPMLPDFQTGSVSSWELGADGAFAALSLDVLTGASVEDGPTSACWIVVSPEGTIVYVASASGAAISSYRLNADGTLTLIDGRAASGSPAIPGAPDPLADADGFIDLVLSADGDFLYQLLGIEGTINVYRTGADGSLSLLQEVTGLLPETNIQGLVFVDLAPAQVPAPAALALFGLGLAGVAGLPRRRGAAKR